MVQQTNNIEHYRKILTKYWGFTSFKPLQEDIIRSVAEGRDTLALMPTGGGKSITFQVPALAKEGTCLVITPLIALMKEQVSRLNSLEIKSLAIHSAMSREEIEMPWRIVFMVTINSFTYHPKGFQPRYFRVK